MSSDDYDVARQRQVGRCPQVFSHLPLIQTAH
jgi:hypothetical protein